MPDDAWPLVFDPSAGRGQGKFVARRAAELLVERGIHTTARAADEAGVRETVSALADQGHDRILVLGGDGTAAEAADGALAAARLPALGFLPAGTGNDFLRHFGVTTLAQAAWHVADAAPKPIDAVRVTYEGQVVHSINVFGIGFMARLAGVANRGLKPLGKRAYTAAALPMLAGLGSSRTRMTLDGKEVEADLVMATACNTTYTGGKMMMAPGARPDDGLVDVVAMRKCARAKAAILLNKMFRGTHMGDPKIFSARARRVRFEPESPSPLMIDGEVYGSTPVDLEVRPGALTVLL